MQFIVALQSNYNPRLSHLLHGRQFTELRAMFRRGRATTYGYDPVTMMQETKTTLCRVMKA